MHRPSAETIKKGIKGGGEAVMAERRMFTKTIIDSDAFLDMPLSTQSLYFHLGMRADDDGFINNPKKIQRMIGCSDDDLKLLFAKRFILVFDSGVIVLKHWKMHNYIQSDRYKPTVYKQEKSLLQLKENGSYTMMDTECIQDGYKMDTQVRLGKVRLGKDNILSPSNDGGDCAKKDTDFESFWSAYPKKVGKADALKAWKKNKAAQHIDKALKTIERMKATDQWQREGGRYIPNPATWINQGRWDDEIEGRQDDLDDLF
jgi:hypothetical protein